MDSEKRTKPKAELKVLAVFRADCRATKGQGSTVAVVQGGSGKCRLYGRNSLALTFPEIADACLASSTPELMAGLFDAPVVVGKAACDKFMADKGLQFAGSEKVVADYGKRERKSGNRVYSYAKF